MQRNGLVKVALAILAVLVWVWSGVGGSQTARAQVNQQDLARMRERIEEGLEQAIREAPEQSTSAPGITLYWKAVPTDPTDIIQRYGGLPAGINPANIARQFQGDISRILNRHLGTIGRAEVTGKVEMKRDIPAGKYFLGLVVRGLAPTGLVLREWIEPTDEELRRDPDAQPHPGREVAGLKVLRSADRDNPAPALTLALEPIPKRDDQFTVRIEIYTSTALTQAFETAEAEAREDD